MLTSDRPEEVMFTAMCRACDFWASIRCVRTWMRNSCPALPAGGIPSSSPVPGPPIGVPSHLATPSFSAVVRPGARRRTPLSGGEIADPAERIVELLKLVADANRAANAATEPQDRRRKRNKVRALRQELQALRDRLADEFGSRFGWIRAGPASRCRTSDASRRIGMTLKPSTMTLSITRPAFANRTDPTGRPRSRRTIMAHG